MRAPPRWLRDGVMRRSPESIAGDQPCPLPCLYHDKHVSDETAHGYVRGTICTLCGQSISRAEWEAELGIQRGPLVPPPFPS